ncbi:unnamed protein product [Fraxinus pennsylvanica]|uniref:DUF7138 domain-containing protein n=1 Tax=Fraxinus pennsylvanica TaxID=56036 RepID=A0AAD2A6M0_9LAMI|nr:unnamed protein product [Fraxinus pennsylvanica]
MVDGGGGTAFPVVFFDGEREMNIGSVYIDAAMQYKRFQLMLSHKIGISPNQISIYLVDLKRNSKFEDRRRIPITGKVNFAFISGEKDCCFLVVLKRSRKSRNRRVRMNGLEFADNLPEYDYSPEPEREQEPELENLILLRRNEPVPFSNLIKQIELENLNDRLQNRRVQRENYQTPMARPNFNPGLDMDPIMDLNSYPMLSQNVNKKAFCKECVNWKNNGEAASFHLCVNDPVTNQFRTRFGPISRPIK